MAGVSYSHFEEEAREPAEPEKESDHVRVKPGILGGVPAWVRGRVMEMERRERVIWDRKGNECFMVNFDMIYLVLIDPAI